MSQSRSPTSSRTDVTLVLLIVMVLTSRALGVNTADYVTLINDAYHYGSDDRHPNARPMVEADTATDVFLDIRLMSILEVNEKDQILKTNLALTLWWMDVSMSWDPESHGNITSFMMKQSEVWLPDIVTENSVISNKQQGYDNLMLRIESDGSITWTPSGIFETSCDIDITFYPFDTQVCDLVFATSVSDYSEVDVSIVDEDPIDLSGFATNGQWVLLSTSAKNDGIRVEFKMQLQRRRSYYVLNILLPILLLSLTSSLTFALPADSGEKMSLSVTVLLAFAVYLTIVDDAMPVTSVQVSVLMVYLVVLMAVSALSVVLSVLVLHYHHLPPSSPVTGCLAAVVLALRCVLFKDGGNVADNDDDEEEAERGKRKLELEMEACEEEEEGKFRRGDSKATATHLAGNHVRTPPRNNSVYPQSVDAQSERSRSDSSGTQPPLTPSVKVEAKAKAKVKARRRSVSGQRVGQTLDRFIFLLFTFLSLGSTAVCLVILSVGARSQRENTNPANLDY